MVGFLLLISSSNISDFYFSTLLRYLWRIHCNMLKYIFKLWIRSPDGIKYIPHTHLSTTLVNLFIDHSRTLLLTLVRAGIGLEQLLSEITYVLVFNQNYTSNIFWLQKFLPTGLYVVTISLNVLFFQQSSWQDFFSLIEVTNTSLQVPYKDFSCG